jgi:hypothetical protein
MALPYLVNVRSLAVASDHVADVVYYPNFQLAIYFLHTISQDVI